MRADPRDQATAVGLLLARLFTGYWFLSSGIGKVAAGYLAGGVLLQELERFAAGTPHGWYAAFLRGVAIPAEPALAVAVALGEIFCGLGLLFGLATRPAAAAGIFMVTNYLFAKGWSAPAGGLDKAFIILLLVVLLGDAGQVLGLDGRWWPARLRRP
jgi:thiosulfate dehydrogenase [quinone] large subunit